MHAPKQSPAAAPPSLQRSVSLVQLFSIAFASMIGVGWITLLGFWLQNAGAWGTVAAFAGGGLVVLLIALAYAEVSAMFPVAGAEAAYAQIAFGNMAAFAVGWMLLFVYISVIAFEMISVGWIATVIVPGLKGAPLYTVLGHTVHAGELAIGVISAIVITGVNLTGASLAARAQFALMVIKIVVSVAFIAAGFIGGSPENLEPGLVLREDGWPLGGVFLIFSVTLLFYGGFNYLPQALEERAANVTARQVCWAMLAAVVSAFLFYSLVVISASMAVDREVLLTAELPAAAAFEAAFGSQLLRNMVLVAGLLGILSAWNGTLFAAGRILYLLGVMRFLPAGVARLSPGSGAPRRAMVLVAGVAFVGGLLGKGAIGPLVYVGAAFIPAVWALVCAGALALRKTRPEQARPYRQPLGVVVFAVALCGALFATAVTFWDAFATAGLASPQAAVLAGVVVAGVLAWLATGRVRAGMSAQERERLILEKT